MQRGDQGSSSKRTVDWSLWNISFRRGGACTSRSTITQLFEERRDCCVQYLSVPAIPKDQSAIGRIRPKVCPNACTGHCVTGSQLWANLSTPPLKGCHNYGVVSFTVK